MPRPRAWETLPGTVAPLRGDWHSVEGAIPGSSESVLGTWTREAGGRSLLKHQGREATPGARRPAREVVPLAVIGGGDDLLSMGTASLMRLGGPQLPG